MARPIGPTERISRRLGTNLFLKGERSLGPKTAVTRRPYAPGQHGQSRRSGKLSEYAIQLREKQKAKAIYGMLEKQFRRYYQLASKATGNTGERLLQLLELRLDNVVYRLGLAASRRQARQLVSHGHVKVDGRKVSIPSFTLSPKQTIEVAELKLKAVENEIPVWLRRTSKKSQGEVLAVPKRDEIPSEIEEGLIVEFYSR